MLGCAAAARAKGYPIGSGCVESAGKLLVEARLKGSGMRWARRNVCPMLVLRAATPHKIVEGKPTADHPWNATCTKVG